MLKFEMAEHLCGYVPYVSSVLMCIAGVLIENSFLAISSSEWICLSLSPTIQWTWMELVSGDKTTVTSLSRNSVPVILGNQQTSQCSSFHRDDIFGISAAHSESLLFSRVTRSLLLERVSENVFLHRNHTVGQLKQRNYKHENILGEIWMNWTFLFVCACLCVAL